MTELDPKKLMTIQKMNDGRVLRTIKSFVLRQGRLTKGQQQAINTLWPQFGVEYTSSILNWKELYQNDNEVVLEIGFGMGRSLVEMAKNNPSLNYLGIEVHLPGVGACLKELGEYNLLNLKVMNHDAVEVLENQIADNSLKICQIFFPDPWHKAKHNKRRLIQTEFVLLLKRKLKQGGIIHLATDWQDYAEHMLEVMNAIPNMKNLSENNTYIDRPEERPLTKFEKRGLELGHQVWDLKFEKRA